MAAPDLRRRLLALALPALLVGADASGRNAPAETAPALIAAGDSRAPELGATEPVPSQIGPAGTAPNETAAAETVPTAWPPAENVPAEGVQPSASLSQEVEDATTDWSATLGPLLRAPATQDAEIGAAIKAYQAGDAETGDKLASSVTSAEGRALLEWTAIRSGTATGFARLDAFLKAHPDYPGASFVQRRAEAALISERRPATQIRSILEARAPITAAGQVALALALKETGRASEATALARRLWRQEALGVALERRVFAAFETVLTSDDHRLRTERQIFRGDGTAALRNAARVSADYVVLAKARLASAKARGTIAPALIAAVPAALQKDISFAFLQAQQARRDDRALDAAKLMVGISRDPEQLGDGDGWWTERRAIARRLLDQGNSGEAYDVASQHGAEDNAERIDAEWHAGFIALRFRNDPATALTHFRKAGAIAESPISTARAAYWEGRAAEALGQEEPAEAAFRRAAEHPVVYYGQLARAHIGLAGLPLRQAPSVCLADTPGHVAIQTLYRIGESQLASQMLIEFGRQLNSTSSLEAIAAIAQKQGDTRTMLAIGKAALQRGFPLDRAAFPTEGVPDFDVIGDPMERAIVHAIARQESAFDPRAVSSAGARGLMQMMPATAKETARRAELPFDLLRLGSDPSYAARMGAAHLNGLLSEWRGSYILTFAAYNAGSGNVRRWIAAYGDPRKPEVDAVDWVERIPFYETRNYVQRVMENLQVYRELLDQRTAYLIDYDLKRGRAPE